MLHSLFIMNPQGEIIIERHWRGRVSRSVGDYFWSQVAKTNGNPQEVVPVMYTQKYYIIHVQRHGLFFVGILHGEAPPLMTTELLHRLVDLLEDYFEVITEESITSNFLTVLQLLDETIDNGFPNTTEAAVLKDMVAEPTVFGKIKRGVTGEDSVTGVVPEYSLGLIPWRKTGVKHTTNEVFFDIVEELDCIIDNNGMLVSGEVNGALEVSCKLSGMPDVLLNFIDPSLLDDCSFHPCVRYARYEQDRTLSFIPPDGNFTLMKYCVNRVMIQPPLYVRPQISYYSSGGKLEIMAGLKNTGGKNIEDVVITIPFPKFVDNIQTNVNIGSVKFDLASHELVWTLKKMTNANSASLTGNIVYQPGTTDIPDSTPSALVQFKLSMVTLSGLKIDSVQIINHDTNYKNFKPYKGVRSISKAGSFQVRTC